MKATGGNLDVRQQLAERFSAPLPECAQRHIVIWHDPEGEFEEEFAQLAGVAGEGAAAEGAADAGDGDGPGAPATAELGGRQVRCIPVRDGELFATKLLVNRQSDGQHLLLYRRRARGELEGDWLADVELYAGHFQADYLSRLVSELEVDDTSEVRGALREYAAFFRSQKRTAKFKAKLSRGSSERDIALGVLCVLCDAEKDDPTTVLAAYANCCAEALEQPEALEQLMELLGKYGALEPLGRLLLHIAGYQGQPDDARAFLRHLLLSALSATLDPGKLQGLERSIAPQNAGYCFGVVNEWRQRAGEDKSSLLYEACCAVEAECDLPKRLSGLPLADLLAADVFPCVNETLLQQLFESVSRGSDRRADMKQVLEGRRSMMWHGLFEVYFRCLEAAAKVQGFFLDHTQAFQLGQSADIWRAYQEDWWQMDAAYRCFCDAYRRSILDLSRLDDAARDLCSWVDSIYTNWFLGESNRCWLDAAYYQFEVLGHAEGIPLQRDFYRDHVMPALGGGKCVVVGICDGMRYGVGRELAEYLERETKGNAEVSAMQAVFPSETKFGMAALLPHRALSFTEEGEVLADGMPTRTTEERQRVLQAMRPASRAVQFSDLVAMSRDQQRQLAEGQEVLYVYQNTIDKAGHGDEAGQDVFGACEQALRDMKALVDIAVKHMGARQVIITADHGFLFTHKGISEIDQVARDALSEAPLEVHRRYLRGPAGASSGPLLQVSGQPVGGERWSWWAARECLRIKAPGSKHFVHGGISLQELCVPVVRFKNSRSGAKDYVSKQSAAIKLLSSNHRVTSNFFALDFFQTEPVGGKVLEAAYELCFTDETGREVSDTQVLRADKADADQRDRQFRVRFNLKPGLQFDSRAAYKLVVRSAATQAVEWSEPFTIDVAFGSEEGFDW